MEIRSFRHKGLERLFKDEDARGLPPDRVKKLGVILTVMAEAEHVSEIGLFPGWRLHRLRGERTGEWSITVTGNWRITFAVEENEIVKVDFEDYH